MNRNIRQRLKNLFVVVAVVWLMFVAFSIGYNDRRVLQDQMGHSEVAMLIRRFRASYSQLVVSEMNEIAVENRWNCSQIRFSYFEKSKWLDAVWAECNGQWREYKFW